jgi:hypothetical protein
MTKKKITYEANLHDKVKEPLKSEFHDPECWPKWAVLLEEQGHLRKVLGTNSKKEAEERYKGMSSLLQSSGCSVFLVDITRPRKPLIKMDKL